MEGPRAPAEQELKDVIEFLNTNLGVGQSWSIAQEYPLVFNSTNLNNIRIIKDGTKMVASAALKQLVVKTPIGIFKVAAIGSVLTDPEYRNLGHSHAILDECLKVATAQGCDFAVLWTDLYDFYGKLGFELGGSEISVHINKEILCQPQGLRFMQSSKISSESISKLYSQHTTGTVRTAAEIQKHLQIPNSRVYTAWDEKNQLQAYAIEGKGRDLSGYIHEWGGGVSKLLPLLNFIRNDLGKSFTIIAPNHAQNLIRQLQLQQFDVHEGYLGMIKILNSDNLIQKMKRYSRSVGIDDFILEKRGNNYVMGTGENLVTTNSDQDLVKIIFGPHKASEIHNFDATTAKAMETLFPVPLWIWGWDSV